jgi:hypothetical protein
MKLEEPFKTEQLMKLEYPARLGQTVCFPVRRKSLTRQKSSQH